MIILGYCRIMCVLSYQSMKTLVGYGILVCCYIAYYLYLTVTMNYSIYQWGYETDWDWLVVYCIKECKGLNKNVTVPYLWWVLWRVASDKIWIYMCTDPEYVCKKWGWNIGAIPQHLHNQKDSSVSGVHQCHQASKLHVYIIHLHWHWYLSV